VSHRARTVWFLLWPLGACFVFFGELGFWINGYTPRETFPIDLGVSSVAIVSGLLLYRSRPDNPTGLLLYAAGAAWTIGGIRAYGNPWAFGVGQCFDGSQSLVLAHLLIAYPTGRLKTRGKRLLVAAGYSLFLLKVISTLTWQLPHGWNGFAVWNAPGWHDALDTAGDVGGGIYALIGIGIVARRWFVASATARRVYAPVLLVAIAFAAASLLDSAVTGITGSEPDWVFFPPNVVLLVIPLAFLFGLMRERLDRVGVGDLVIELDDSGRATLRESLARALQDQSVEVGYRIASDEYVGADGVPVELPPEGGHRVVTRIEREGTELAVIVHDRALLEHPRLVESVAATAGLFLDNERLQTELRAQLDALRASRARVVQSADAERRRLERDLHDGAQQRLLGLGLVLQLLRGRLTEANHGSPELLDEADHELQHALRELRELARGIHPAILTDQGLASAARSLAVRTPIPVTVHTENERLPAAIETAGYFIVAEALANATRYARASHVVVTIARSDGCAVIAIEDDGVGGADAGAGSGLAGLADRVAALNGRLVIESATGSGTRVTAEIPCA
jgi:signal transduction histidine kinase